MKQRIISRVKPCFDIISKLLFPPKCMSCEELLETDLSLSKSENSILEKVFCKNCQVDYYKSKNETCEVCKNTAEFCCCIPETLKKANVQKAIHVGKYYSTRKESNSSVQRFIFSHKTYQNTDAYKLISNEISPFIMALSSQYKSENEKAEIILTYVPRSSSRISENGFDHAKETAKVLSFDTKIKFLELINRIKDGKMQKNLEFVDRQKNTAEMFEIDREIKIKDAIIFLYDDVITSGSTISACAKELYKNGAKEVVALCFAKV